MKIIEENGHRPDNEQPCLIYCMKCGIYSDYWNTALFSGIEEYQLPCLNPECKNVFKN